MFVGGWRSAEGPAKEVDEMLFVDGWVGCVGGVGVGIGVGVCGGKLQGGDGEMASGFDKGGLVKGDEGVHWGVGA